METNPRKLKALMLLMEAAERERVQLSNTWITRPPESDLYLQFTAESWTPSLS